MSKIWLLCNRNTDLEHENIQIIKESLLKEFKDDFKIIYSDEIAMSVSNEKGLYITNISGEIMKSPKIIFYGRDDYIPYKDCNREIILLRHLEIMGVYIVDSVDGIVNCDNKFLQLSILRNAGLPVPKTVCATNAEFKKTILHADIGNKCVIKSIYGCCGNEVFLGASKDMLRDISGCLNHDRPYLFQEYIEFSHGRTLRIEIINNKIVGAYELQATDDNLKSSVSCGGEYKNVLGKFLDAEIIALKASLSLGVDIAGIDLLFKEDGSFVICEINTAPGLEWNNHINDLSKKAIVEIALEQLSLIGKENE